jgi:hypothetical protein
MMPPTGIQGDRDGSGEAAGQAPVGPAPASLPSLPLSGENEIGPALLGLMKQMEASLEESQKAVLASDGLRLENSTREQVRLHRACELLLWPQAWPGTPDRQAARRMQPQGAPPVGAELLAAARLVLQGTRVQAALLRRAQQFQCILSNVAAAQALLSKVASASPSI